MSSKALTEESTPCTVIDDTQEKKVMVKLVEVLSKVLAISLIILVLSLSISNVCAATSAQIEQATSIGVAWLVKQQQASGCPAPSGLTGGCWSPKYNPVGVTGLAVLKLETHAVLQGLSPFDPKYAYSTNVASGLAYLFANAHLGNLETPPVPGVYFLSPGGSNLNYETAIALMAIVSCTDPARAASVQGNTMTYHEVAAGVVSFLAWAQISDPSRVDVGGWNYDLVNNPTQQADNSNSGFVVIALHFAETPQRTPPTPGGFGLTISASVKNNLNSWINYIQENGGTDDGGSYYSDPPSGVPNVLRTGSLLQEMALVGDTAATPRVQRAIDYLVLHWNDLNFGEESGEEGWKGKAGEISNYLATLTVMQGALALGLQRIGGIDWYNDFADAIVGQQNLDGSWPGVSVEGTYLPPVLITTWALLSLEEASPNHPSPTPPVGGTLMAVSKLALLAPYLALLGVIAMVSVASKSRRLGD